MSVKTREIWEKGTPLCEASYTWATDANRKRLLELDQPNSIELAKDKSPSEKLFSLIGQFQKITRIPKEMAEIHSDMKADLVKWLFEEDLYAFGFPVFPKAARTPRLISAEFWANAVINWDKDIAEDAEYKFQRIRIVEPEEFPEINLKPKIGRKTNRDLISEAISEILKSDTNFPKETHKIKASRIREFIKSSNPEIDPFGPGFGDDAIRKHVNSYFNK